jgi:hypothetical protein
VLATCLLCTLSTVSCTIQLFMPDSLDNPLNVLCCAVLCCAELLAVGEPSDWAHAMPCHVGTAGCHHHDSALGRVIGRLLGETVLMQCTGHLGWCTRG